ncbi:hypothetical protein PO909_029523 [Leuciscus waleckii]
MMNESLPFPPRLPRRWTVLPAHTPGQTLRMEVSHAHPPATESEYQLDAKDIFQESGEWDPFSPMNLPVCQSSSSVMLTPPSLPLPPALLTGVGSTLFFIVFCSSLYARPQSSATDTTQSSSSPIGNSVAISPEWSEPVAPPPASECSDPPRPVALAPALLPPSTLALTFGCSTSPGSFGPRHASAADLRPVHCPPALYPFGFG